MELSVYDERTEEIGQAERIVALKHVHLLVREATMRTLSGGDKVVVVLHGWARAGVSSWK